ncbi:hypothetical protein [Pseudoalteromonas sp. 68 DY56-GL68]|uniref:hypothetical protein n=1 Tax=Pseudoalteromonas sp. 68 DY56-GL68 TaxID=2974919 RepID=UPI00352A0770
MTDSGVILVTSVVLSQCRRTDAIAIDYDYNQIYRHAKTDRKRMEIRTSLELLDWFKSVADVDSDYMVSKLTGIPKQTLSTVRTKNAEFSDLTALKLLLVGEHPEPLETMALLEAYKAERKGNEADAEIWRKSVA